LKLTLTNLKVNYLQSFTLKKQISNRFIAESIDNELIYDDKEDFDYLLQSSVKGDDKEEGTIETQCETEVFTKDVFLKHNDGKFNLRGCIAFKQIQLKNILDCVINETINIFDYEPSPTKTIQGSIDKAAHTNSVMYYIGDNTTNTITLEQCLSLVGNYPDKSGEGFYPEYIEIKAVPKSEFGTEPSDLLEIYLGHEVSIFVQYIRIKDSIKHDEYWLPFSGGYYYSQIPAINWKPSETEVFYPIALESGNGSAQAGYSFDSYKVKAGKLNTYTKTLGSGAFGITYIPIISNTYLINPILTEVFECTGKQVVSNFLNINPDQTQPANSVYEFADKYCKQLKIAQSYDIIREKALQDSFGESGKIKTKDLLGNIFGMFNLNLVFDKEADVLRLEHISYFTTKGIDLTAKNYEIGDVAINSQQIDVETFSFAQPTPTEGFYSVKIEYERKDLYSDQNEINYQANRILTDVFGCINNPDFDRDEYKPLFFIMATADNSIIGLNSMLAMRVIMPRLHSMMRPSKTGKIGSEHITFDSYSIGMETEVKMLGSIKMWDKINPYYSVKTNQGSFLITEVTFDNAGELKMKVIK